MTVRLVFFMNHEATQDPETARVANRAALAKDVSTKCTFAGPYMYAGDHMTLDAWDETYMAIKGLRKYVGTALTLGTVEVYSNEAVNIYFKVPFVYNGEHAAGFLQYRRD